MDNEIGSNARSAHIVSGTEAAWPGFVREPEEYSNANLAPYDSCFFYAPAMFRGGTH